MHSTRSELRRKHRVLSQAQVMAAKVWTLHCGKSELLSCWNVSSLRVYHGMWKQKTHHGHKESPDSEVCARPKDIANYTIMELSPSIFLEIWLFGITFKRSWSHDGDIRRFLVPAIGFKNMGITAVNNWRWKMLEGSLRWILWIFWPVNEIVQ